MHLSTNQEQCQKQVNTIIFGCIKLIIDLILYVCANSHVPIMILCFCFSTYNLTSITSIKKKVHTSCKAQYHNIKQ